MLQEVKGDLFRVTSSVTIGSFLRALICNPSFQASLLIRLALETGRVGYVVFRQVLIWKHGIDVGKGAKIDAGLYLPHPVNIVIGKGVRIGEDVTLYQGVTLGKSKGCYPTIGDGAVIFPNSVIAGGSYVENNAKVPPLTVIVKGD